MSSGGTDPQHILLLGQIAGKLDGVLAEQGAQRSLLNRMDERLQAEERQTARTAIITSTAIGVGMALIIDRAKAWFASGGGGSA